jgi:predicted permease
LLTESVLLAFVGGALGSLVAVWGVKLLVKIVNADLVTKPDLRVLSFTAGVCLLTGMLFGMVPALRSVHFSLTPALKEVPTDKAHSRWSWGKGLVMGQVALSLFVLFAAGLLVRSLRNLKTVDTGYSQEHLLLVRLDPIAAGYSRQQIGNFARRLLETLPSTPGVRAVTLSENGLFSGTEGDEAIGIPGIPLMDNDRVVANDLVAPNYFSTLGIPILLGRDIGQQDIDTSPEVAVINQSMAKFYFRDGNPIGRKFYIDDQEHKNHLIEIVGVVADSKQNALSRPPERRYYRPFFQESERRALGINVEVRSFGKPEVVANDLRRQIQSIDPQMTIDRIRSMKDLIDLSIGGQIAMARLSAFFAGLALLLACIGLYGIVSYSVAGRTREIGVRMALGAQRRNVLWLVLAEALMLVGVGIVIGIPAALAGSRVLSSMLFGLKATDPSSLGIVTLTLSSVAAMASYIPAWRATRIDPITALRYE